VAEGQKPIPLQGDEVVDQHPPERIGRGCGVEQLVLDRADALEERRYGSEEAVASARIELADPQSLSVPRDERRRLILIEDGAVAVDRADEEARQAIPGTGAQPLLDLLADP
jgi:hypothetical protein